MNALLSIYLIEETTSMLGGAYKLIKTIYNVFNLEIAISS